MPVGKKKEGTKGAGGSCCLLSLGLDIVSAILLINSVEMVWGGWAGNHGVKDSGGDVLGEETEREMGKCNLMTQLACVYPMTCAYYFCITAACHLPTLPVPCCTMMRGRLLLMSWRLFCRPQAMWGPVFFSTCVCSQRKDDRQVGHSDGSGRGRPV